jgi:RimJ/RimL family protein N-acetyltransferase
MSFPLPHWPLVSADRAAAIRAAMRDPHVRAAFGEGRVLLSAEAIPLLYGLVRDPAVSDPIYVIPKPVTLAGVTAWAGDMLAAQDRGEGTMFLTLDAAGAVSGYSEFLLWPEHAAGEIGGALRADLQGSGAGAAGFARGTDWLFRTVGLDRIALTAATDNLRSQRMIDRLGFIRQGELDSRRPDGTFRRSVHWELTREEWGQGGRE